MFNKTDEYTTKAELAEKNFKLVRYIDELEKRIKSLENYFNLTYDIHELDVRQTKHIKTNKRGK